MEESNIVEEPKLQQSPSAPPQTSQPPNQSKISYVYKQQFKMKDYKAVVLQSKTSTINHKSIVNNQGVS